MWGKVGVLLFLSPAKVPLSWLVLSHSWLQLEMPGLFSSQITISLGKLPQNK